MTTDATSASWTPIIIRRSEIIDLPALRRLAALDSRRLPEGTFLVAEIGDELVAAAPIESGDAALGDPFRHTADLRRLLERQACSIRQRSALVVGVKAA
jgi:hypothetical protein